MTIVIFPTIRGVGCAGIASNRTRFVFTTIKTATSFISEGQMPSLNQLFRTQINRCLQNVLRVT